MNSVTLKSNRATFGRVAVLMGCLLAGSAGAAQAAPAPEAAPRIVVQYGDLDLTTDAGVSALYQRISAAAAALYPIEHTRELGRVAKNRAYREAAIERAVNAVNNPHLLAMLPEHTKRG